MRGELKKVTGSNNIERYAKKAVEKQNAEIVIFQIDTDTEAVHLELYKLKKKGYKVFYFFTDNPSDIYEI